MPKQWLTRIIVIVVVVLAVQLVYWKIYEYNDCRHAGHSKFICGSRVVE